MIILIKSSFIFLFLISANLFAQPILEIENGNTYDWGLVSPEDSPLKAEIKFLNKGNDTLKILEVKPGCGCTTAPLDKNIIPPNSYGTLKVTLSIKNYTGKVNKNIKIKTNMKNSIVILYLNANVFRPISVEGARYFNYGDFEAGTEQIKKVTLKNNTKKDITIKNIERIPDYCSLNIKKGSVIPAQGELNVSAKINILQKGPFSFSLKITTSESEEPDAFISGWGRVK
jgi:hypothetical protein